MSVERIIGIDFGTSTSVVKVKTYKDNQPKDAKEIADYVRFDNKDTLPTLVYKTTNDRYLVGYEAENAAVKGVLHQNFKLDLINPDPVKREEAKQYTEIFLKYLYDTYSEQKNYFSACDMETTYVSYPAKWSDELRETMISLVRKAGFKNVYGLDEPTAAIHTVMVQESSKLLLNDDDSANILMIDMGAGTTDLVLSRYAPNSEQPISIINVWPKADSPCLFGGREIDEILCEYVRVYLEKCGLPNIKNFREKYLDKCKVWKENNISPVFEDIDGVVSYCGFADTLVAMLNADFEFPPLSRESFEDMLKDYLVQFTKMINDCLDDAGFSHDDLDYVILTGGHSQWYFTNEILGGSLLKFGRVDLPRVQGDKKRVIKLSRPQETVALGLVYQRITVKPISRKQAMEEDAAYCIYCGAKRPASAVFCPSCGKSAASQPAPATPTAPGTASPPTVNYNSPGKTEIYLMPPGKDIAGLTGAISAFLIGPKGMDTQIINLEGGNVMLQARDRGGKWKQFIGMDKAITVRFEKVDLDRVSVNIGEAKWVDKAGVMALSMVILWPLAITSGVGMYIQGKLPGEIRSEITRHLAS